MVGCRGSSDEESTIPPTATPSDLALAINVGQVDGDSVPLQLVLRNSSSTSQTFSLAGTKESDYIGTYDIAVTAKGDDKVVWNWMYDKTGYDSLQFVTLAPGEQLSWDPDWNRRDNQGNMVEPGVYVLSATLDWVTEDEQRLRLTSTTVEVELS